MPPTVQYLDKSWIIKLLNFVEELLILNDLTEEYAFEVLDRTKTLIYVKHIYLMCARPRI